MANTDTYAYVSPEVNLNLTSAAAGWATPIGVAVFYKTSNNIWRMKCNIAVTITTATSVAMTVNNVVFAVAATQAMAAATITTAPYTAVAVCSANSSTLTGYATATSTGYRISGDVELASKPTAYLPDGV